MLRFRQLANPPGSRAIKDQDDPITSFLKLFDRFQRVRDAAHVSVRLDIGQNHDRYACYVMLTRAHTHHSFDAQLTLNAHGATISKRPSSVDADRFVAL